MSDTFFDALLDALRRATEYNKHDQAAPAVVLWPDKERQWEPLVPRLREELPILTLGPYNPVARTGPAIWLRCMIARTLPEADWQEAAVPILYLPGVSKQELRAVEECPRHLQPLAELQYRGALFTQRNGRDWTIAAFLQSADGGLQIPVASDTATREAIQRALLKLADEPLSTLHADAPLTAAKFNAFLNPEPVRDLLLWMNDPAGRKAATGPAEWEAFRATCKEQFDFDPDGDGEVTAATLLGGREEMWSTAWNRFVEAPSRYPNLPDLLRRARPDDKAESLFFHRSSWPQDNEHEEAKLRQALTALRDATPAQARGTVLQQEAEHGPRREWVWAELGRAPLACALPHLVTLADGADAPLGGATPAEIAEAYASGGWKMDRAALEALSIPRSQDDAAAMRAAVDALYRPWLEKTVEAFQQAVKAHPLASGHEPGGASPPKPGRCLLFADGLRYDIAQGLAKHLQENGLAAAVEWRFGALPGVTPSAKPAISPVAPLLGPAAEFGTMVRADGAKVTADILRRELAQAGYEVLLGSETGTPTGAAWTECGHLDSYGHEQGWRLATRVPEEVREIAGRVVALLTAGWREVRILTDHGWLLLPSALPKADLPEHLTEARKGRCARLKPTSQVAHQTVPWYWDKNVTIAVAPGIGSYIAGKEYEHGGLSPQECVVPVLTVTSAAPTAPAASIAEVRWTGLRCRIKVNEAGSGLTADLRTKAADAATSIAAAARALDADGKASLVVPDDCCEGAAAVVIVMEAGGRIVVQRPTVVGEES